MTDFTFGGGINELNDIAIAREECVSGQNFELGLGNTKFMRRKPFDLLDTTPNASNIHGIHQLVERDGTKTTLVASGTVMYEWDGSTFTSRGTVVQTAEFHDFDWELDETIIIVDRNKADVVKEWDGTTLSDLTTGLGVNFYAKYGIVEANRAWFANITTGSTAVPHMLVASAFENRQDYDTAARGGEGGFATGKEAFYLLTPNLKPINGLIQFKNDTIISTEGGTMYRLVGDDASNYRFVPYYAGSAAIGDNAFVDAGDDVYYMREGGVIESLRATESYGDVGTDDISLQVKETVKDQDDARIVYDRTNRKILFWLPSKILVLFKDLLDTDLSPFSIYKTAHPSAFNTEAVKFMRYPDVVNDDFSVFFGDSIGNVYDLNGSGTDGDAGTDDIVTTRRLPLQVINDNDMVEGRVYYRRKGECQLNMTFEWGDARSQTDLTIVLKGSLEVAGNYYGGAYYYGGDFYYNEGLSGSGNPVSRGFSATGKGSSVFATLSVTTSEEFEVDFLEVPTRE